MSDNWWEEAPVAETKAEPETEGSWRESAPIESTNATPKAEDDWWTSNPKAEASPKKDWSIGELLLKGIEKTGEVGDQVVKHPLDTLEKIGDFGQSAVESAPKVIGSAVSKAATGAVQLIPDLMELQNKLDAQAFKQDPNLQEEAKASQEKAQQAEALSHSVEDVSNKVTPEYFQKLTPAENTSSDVLSLVGGGVAGASKAVKGLDGASKLFKGVSGISGAALGESAVAGSKTHLEPTVLGTEDTSLTVKNRILNPIEGAALGAGISAVVASVKAAAPVVKAKVSNYFGKPIEETVESTGLAPDVLDEAISKMGGETRVEPKISSTEVTPQVAPVKDKVNFGEGFGDRLINQPEISAGTANLQDILGDTSLYTGWVNKYGKLFSIERARANTSGLDVGSKDILEKSDVSKVTNRAAQGRTPALGLIGDTTATEAIIRDADGKLVSTTELKPLRRIYQEAADNGGTEEELKQFLAAKDAFDDYANVEVKKANLQQTIREAIAGDESASVVSKLESELKSLDNYESRMPVQEAYDTIQSYYGKPWAHQALEDNNKLNRYILNELKRSGVISADDVARIQAAHPNYVPSFKVVEDLTGDNKLFRKPGSTKGIKARTGSGYETIDVMEAQVRNIVNSMGAVEKSSINNMMFENLMKLPENELSEVFLESKSDIVNALGKLKDPKIKRLGADQVSPVDVNTIRQVGNVKFFVDGKELQLTLKDPDLVQLFNNAETIEDVNLAYKLARSFANFSRSMIVTVDPTFNVRSLEREAQDFAAFKGKKGGFIAPLLRGEKPDYVPLASQVKNIFLPELNPELNKLLRANYGRSNFRDLEGLTTDELVSKATGRSEQPTSLIGKVSKALGKPLKPAYNALHGFSERVDLAPRAVAYQVMLKNGATHDEAMRTAFELGFNPAQSGLNQSVRKITRLIPFSSAFINSTDRLLRAGRYEPKKLATGFLLGVYPAYKAVDIWNQQWVNPKTGKPWQDDADPNIGRYTMRIYGPWSKSVNDYVPYSLGWVVGRAAVPFDRTLKYAYDHMEKGMNALADDILNRDTPEAKELKSAGIIGKDVIHGWMNYVTDLAALPTTIPGVSPIMAVRSNEDRLGRQIVPEHIAQKKEENKWMEYDTNTSPILRDYSKAMHDIGFDISPKVTQYLYENMTFGAGRVGLDLADKVYSVLGHGPEQPQDLNFPGSKVLFGDLNDRPRSGKQTQFKGIKDEVFTSYEGYKDLEKKVQSKEASKDDLRSYLKDHKVSLKFYQDFKNSSEEISGLYKEIDSLKSTNHKSTPEREVMGDPKKREAVAKLEKKIDAIQGKLINRVKATKGAEDLYFKRNRDVTLPEELLYDSSSKLSKISEKIGKLIKHKPKED